MDHAANGQAAGLDDIRASDHPDWMYLIHEFYAIYRYHSAGGSKRIRTHMRIVREQISRCLAGDPPLRVMLPETKPVCAHLGRSLDNGERDRMASVVKAVEKLHHGLVWRHGYETMPRDFEKKYAYAEVLGPRGPVVFPGLTLGLVLFAPRTTYPAHYHQGITESYVCLSGAVSQNDAGVYLPGSMIINMPEHEHAITTSDHEPVLLAYAWTGSPEALANQTMVFSRRVRR